MEIEEFNQGKSYASDEEIGKSAENPLISQMDIQEESIESSFPSSGQNLNSGDDNKQRENKNEQIVTMNDIIFEKLKRIELGTYRKEDFDRLHANLYDKQMNQRELSAAQFDSLMNSDTFSSGENSKVEWKDMDLAINDTSNKLLVSVQDSVAKKSKKQQMKSHPVTRILVKELQTKNIFYLIGNVIIDFKSGVYFSSNLGPHSKSTIFDLEESRVVNNAMKQIVQVENNFSFQEVTINLQLNVKPMVDFDFITQIFKQKGTTQISKEIATYLEIYQTTVGFKQREYIKRAMKRAEECQIDFSVLLQERSKILKQMHKSILEEYDLTHTGFYCMSYFCADYNSEEINLQQFSYSYPLLALIGFDPNQFSNGVSKKGQQVWIYPETRARLLISGLKDWCRLNSGSTQLEDEIDPFYFITLDDMVISTKGRKVRKFIKYEGILSYIFEGVADSVSMVIVDVDIFTIKRVLTMRKDYVLHQKATQFIDDFEYNIQSQIFLEKYYNDRYQEFVNVQEKLQVINEKKAYDDTKVCSYRLINQTQHPQIIQQEQ